MKRQSLALVVGSVILLAGCGAPVTSALGSSNPTSVKAADDSDHAQVNAIVKDTLTKQWAYLMAKSDVNHDQKICDREYADRDADVRDAFYAAFDTNKDGCVTADEYQAAMNGTQAIEAFHHLAESKMEAAIDPYMADKDFDLGEMRDYMTRGLGLTGDWPYLAKVFAKMDLNQDDKLLSGAGEGPAFMLTFIRQQLERALKMPVTAVPAN